MVDMEQLQLVSSQIFLCSRALLALTDPAMFALVTGAAKPVRRWRSGVRDCSLDQVQLCPSPAGRCAQGSRSSGRYYGSISDSGDQDTTGERSLLTVG